MNLHALQSDPKEFANSVTHGIGLALSITGGIVLLATAAAQGSVWSFAGCFVYAAALVAVYAASTLSHVCQDQRRKWFFRVLDQGVIYLLIAGTFTPFALVFLRSGWWWLLLTAMWTIALAGFISKVVWVHRIESVSISACVLLGWMPATATPPLLHVLPMACMLLMLLGGVFYTVGTLFLRWDEHHDYYHAVWHLFVIAGSACHFFAILWYVAPVSV